MTTPYWFTASTLVASRLPDVPATVSDLLTRAESEGWRDRLGHDRLPLMRGGKDDGADPLIHITLLPVSTRTAHALDQMHIAFPPQPSGASLQSIPGTLSEEDGMRATILLASRQFVPLSGLGQELGLETFARFYNRHAFPVANGVRRRIPTVSRSTLRRWARTMCAISPLEPHCPGDATPERKDA